MQKIPQTIRICSHFQNKPYKTTPRFLPDLTIPGKHHTTRKQYQNRKWIKKTFLHSVPPYFWEFFPYHFLFPLFTPVHSHIKVKILQHHIKVKILQHHIKVKILQHQIKVKILQHHIKVKILQHHIKVKILQHHIKVNIFQWNKICWNPFPPSTFCVFFPISSRKLFPLSQKKSLMKHLTLNLPLLPVTPLSSSSSYHFPDLLINRKTQKTVLVWKSSLE